MHILKLALPLAGLLMTGQALAHKVSHTVATTTSPARPAIGQIDTSPAALLDAMSGRGVQGTSALPGMTTLPAPEKNNVIATHINRRH